MDRRLRLARTARSPDRERRSWAWRGASDNSRRRDSSPGRRPAGTPRWYGRGAPRFQEFVDYITANMAAIANYADRCRHDEPIATGFTESAVNQLVSKRRVKKQQRRWTQRAAHTLLQVGARVLNRQLRRDFERWHPQLVQNEAPQSPRSTRFEPHGRRPASVENPPGLTSDPQRLHDLVLRSPLGSWAL